MEGILIYNPHLQATEFKKFFFFYKKKNFSQEIIYKK